MPASDNTRELNPTNLQDPIDQNLMLMFLKFGELQLAINERVNEVKNAKQSFYNRNQNNYFINFLFLKIRPRIVRKSMNRINSIYRNLTTLQILIINRRALGELGTEVAKLCDFFEKLLNSNRPINDAFFKRLDALYAETETLKKNLQEKEQFQYVDYTHLTPGKSYPLPTEISAASGAYSTVKIVDHSLLLRHRGKGKKGVVYEMWQSNQGPIGIGSFANVFKLISKLKKSFGKVYSWMYGGDTESQYVLKQSNSDALGSKEDVLDEAKILEHAVHTHSKPPRIDEQGGHLVIQYFSGKELFDLLEDNDKNFTNVFFFELVLKILQAYKSQIYDQGIIHSDIKPENIMVEIKQTNFGMRVESVNFVDFNVSQMREGAKSSKGGTPGYHPPERMLPLNQTTSYDIYSLAIVLIEIIAKMCANEKKRDEFYQEFKMISSLSLSGNFLALFKNIKGNLISHTEKMLDSSGLSPSLQVDFVELVKTMLAFSPHKRPSIERLIYTIEKIEKEFNETKDKKCAKIDAKAKSTKKELELIEKNLKTDPEILLIPEADGKNNLVNKPLEQLKITILDGCSDIEDGPDLKLFLDKLDVKALENLDTQEAVIHTIDEIISKFEKIMSDLLELYECVSRVIIENYQLENIDFDPLEVMELKDELAEIIDKHHKFSLTLDNFVALTSRLEKRLERLSKNVDLEKYSNINMQRQDALEESKEEVAQDKVNSEKKNHEISIFKEKVTEAIEQYESESDVRFNHLFHQRAFSPTRKKQIEEIRGIVRSEGDLDTLISKVTEITKNIDSGFFPNSKSILKENLEYVLFDYPQANRNSAALEV